MSVSGAKDTKGNTMDADSTTATFVNTPPETDPPEESGRTGLSVTTTSSYVSPAYVKGVKPANAYDVQWRYENEAKWRSVSADAANGTGVCADTWWWTEIDLDKSGKKKNLSESDRNITIVVRSVNAAGDGKGIEHTIEWKMMEVGKSREEQRHDGTVTLTDHLIQEGRKMIVTGPANVPHTNPPASTEVHITSSEFPEPEVWRYEEHQVEGEGTPNWIHTFEDEGHWVLKAGFHCHYPDQDEPSTVDKSGQVMLGGEVTTTIHVINPDISPINRK